MFVDRLSTLIPDTARRQVALELPMRDFEMAYRLDCRNLCADFCEDIEFRFSLGLGSLLRRFLGKTGMQRFARGYSQVCMLPAAFPTVSLSWYNKSSVAAEMGDRLATTDMGRKVGGCCAPFHGGGWVPI